MTGMFKLLSSMRLTVFLFALSIVIIFTGTLAQIDKGIWTVVDSYFRSACVYIEFNIFFPRTMKVPGGFYFPGGWLIGFALMVNLFCAHVVRFKATARGWRLLCGALLLALALLVLMLVILGTFGHDINTTHQDAFWRVLWRLGKGGGVALLLLAACLLLFGKRAGIVLIHCGVFLLLVSELVTGLFAVESTMLIKEGEVVNFIDHSNTLELAFTNTSEPDHDIVTVVPSTMLKTGALIRHEQLPCDIKVLRYLRNSSFPEKMKFVKDSDNPATAGAGLEYAVRESGEESGVSLNQQKDTPSAYVTLLEKNSGRNLGTYLVSLWFYGNHTQRELDLPQKLLLNGRTYTMMLRYEREILFSKGSAQPFSLHLLDFKHETYIGTNKPSNFSSLVRLRDPGQKIDREVNIWMNNPMRYADLTFYQSSFLPDDSGTVLQVVRNSGWMIPYLACMIVTTGLLVHMLAKLLKFLRKSRLS